MKLRKFLGGFLLGLGCVVVFIGLMAAVLPMIANDQLRLVLSSFEMPSQNIVVNAFNAVMTYALANCYLVMLFGAGGIGVGLLLMLGAREREPDDEYVPPRPQARTRPAYTVATDEREPDAVPVWHAQEKAEPNPFADASISAMLAPKVTPKVAEPAGSNPFAPTPLLRDEPAPQAPYQRAYQPQAVDARTDAYKPPVASAEPSDDRPAAYAPSVASMAVASSQPAAPTYAPPSYAPPPDAPQAPVAMPQPTKPLDVSPTKPEPQVIFRSPSLRAPQASSDARIRSTFRPASFKPESAKEPEADAISQAISDAMPEPKTAEAPVSPRIKSTMGKHS